MDVVWLKTRNLSQEEHLCMLYSIYQHLKNWLILKEIQEGHWNAVRSSNLYNLESKCVDDGYYYGMRTKNLVF